MSEHAIVPLEERALRAFLTDYHDKLTELWDRTSFEIRDLYAVREQAFRDVAGTFPVLAREKFCYVGAPAIFKLERACKSICEAFGDYGCYGVGSAWQRADWRDVDVRFVMKDEAFYALFPRVRSESPGTWEFDDRWLLLTTAISAQLSAETGLPIDFQFQPQSFANSHFKGLPRHPLGLMMIKDNNDD